MNKQKCIMELKNNVNANKEEFIKLRSAYFIALAINETNNKIDEEAKTEVLKNNVFNVAEEWTEDYKEEKRILKPNRDHLMTNEDFKTYIHLVKIERDKKGLIIPEDYTADYQSRPYLNKVRTEFLRVALKIVPSEMREDFKPFVDNYHYKFTEKFLDLSLKLEV